MPFFYRSTDPTAYARELQRLSNEGSGADRFIKPEFTVFRPTPGSNTVRILPCSWDRKPYPHWSLRISKHDGIGPGKRSAVLCPYHTDRKHERCPICEDLQHLSEDEAQGLVARHRSLVWIIDRSHEEKGPQIWDITQRTETSELFNLMKDIDTGETVRIDHPETGRDIVFERTGEGIGTRYGSYRLRNRSNLVAEGHLEYITSHPLPSVLIWRDYNEIKAIYTGVGPDTDTRQRRLDIDDEPVPQREPLSAPANGGWPDEEPPFDTEEEEPPPLKPVVRTGKERASELLRRRKQI